LRRYRSVPLPGSADAMLGSTTSESATRRAKELRLDGRTSSPDRKQRSPWTPNEGALSHTGGSATALGSCCTVYTAGGSYAALHDRVLRNS
jgi:hypothetical protein